MVLIKLIQTENPCGLNLFMVNCKLLRSIKVTQVRLCVDLKLCDEIASTCKMCGLQAPKALFRMSKLTVFPYP